MSPLFLGSPRGAQGRYCSRGTVTPVTSAVWCHQTSPRAQRWHPWDAAVQGWWHRCLCPRCYLGSPRGAQGQYRWDDVTGEVAPVTSAGRGHPGMLRAGTTRTLSQRAVAAVPEPPGVTLCHWWGAEAEGGGSGPWCPLLSPQGALGMPGLGRHCSHPCVPTTERHHPEVTPNLLPTGTMPLVGALFAGGTLGTELWVVNHT